MCQIICNFSAHNTKYFCIKKKSLFATHLFRVVVDDHKVRRCLVEVARVDGPRRVVPPVPGVAVVELHAVHVQVVDAALDVDAQPK